MRSRPLLKRDLESTLEEFGTQLDEACRSKEDEDATRWVEELYIGISPTILSII